MNFDTNLHTPKVDSLYRWFPICVLGVLRARRALSRGFAVTPGNKIMNVMKCVMKLKIKT